MLTRSKARIERRGKDRALFIEDTATLLMGEET